jgi:hypothetical protein
MEFPTSFLLFVSLIGIILGSFCLLLGITGLFIDPSLSGIVISFLMLLQGIFDLYFGYSASKKIRDGDS